MKEKIYLESKVKKIDKKIEKALKRAGIVYPHPSCSFFRSVYAELGKGRVNKNGVVLAQTVEQDVPQLIGCQVNFSHERYGNICGQIIFADVNENNEIEIVFTFHRNVYSEEFEDAMEALDNGFLSVSFELRVSEENVTITKEGYREVSRCDFDGCGLLIGEDEKPACPAAKILTFAKQKILELIGQRDDGLVFAKESVVNCQDLLESINLAIEEKGAQYLCECIECGKVVKSSNHCKDLKCSSCGAQMRRKDRPGPGRAMENSQEDKESDLQDINLLKTEKGEKSMDKKTNDALTAEFKKQIVDELGEEVVKDWSDEDFLNEEKIVEARKILDEKSKAKSVEEEKAKEEEKKKLDEKAKADDLKKKEESEKAKADEEKVEVKKSVSVTEEKMITTVSYDDESGEEVVKSVGTRTVMRDGKVVTDEKFDNSVMYTYAQVEEIKAEYEKQLKVKDEEIKSKVDEVEKSKENATKIAEIKAELGDNVKDFSDEDFLNEDKVENARLKKENGELKSKKNPDTFEKASDNDKDLQTGDEKGKENEELEDKGQEYLDKRYQELKNKR